MKKVEWKNMNKGAGSNAVYGLGLIGALIYYVQHAATFGQVVLGIIKAVLWPAFVIFKLLEFLNL